jgi:hypothetical protein
MSTKGAYAFNLALFALSLVASVLALAEYFPRGWLGGLAAASLSLALVAAYGLGELNGIRRARGQQPGMLAAAAEAIEEHFDAKLRADPKMFERLPTEKLLVLVTLKPGHYPGAEIVLAQRTSSPERADSPSVKSST